MADQLPADPLIDFLGDENDTLFAWAENEAMPLLDLWESPLGNSDLPSPISTKVVEPPPPKPVENIVVKKEPVEVASTNKAPMPMFMMTPVKPLGTQPQPQAHVMPQQYYTPVTCTSMGQPVHVQPVVSVSVPIPTSKATIKKEPEDQKNNKRKQVVADDDDKDDDGCETTKESKKQRRLIRNRMSAQLHRERKRAYVDQLERQLKDAQEETAGIRRHYDQVVNEKTLLKDQLVNLQSFIASSGLTLPPHLVPVYDVDALAGVVGGMGAGSVLAASSSPSCSSPPSSPELIMHDDRNDESCSSSSVGSPPPDSLAPMPLPFRSPPTPPVPCMMPAMTSLQPAPTMVPTGYGTVPGVGMPHAGFIGMPTLAPATVALAPAPSTATSTSGGVSSVYVSSSAPSSGPQTAATTAAFARKATMLLALVLTVAMYGSPILSGDGAGSDGRSLSSMAAAVAAADSSSAVVAAPSLDLALQLQRMGLGLTSTASPSTASVAHRGSGRVLTAMVEEEEEEMVVEGEGELSVEEWEGVLSALNLDDGLTPMVDEVSSNDNDGWYTPDGMAVALVPHGGPSAGAGGDKVSGGGGGASWYRPAVDAPWRYTDPVSLFPLPALPSRVLEGALSHNPAAPSGAASTALSLHVRDEDRFQQPWMRAVLGREGTSGGDDKRNNDVNEGVGSFKSAGLRGGPPVPVGLLPRPQTGGNGSGSANASEERSARASDVVPRDGRTSYVLATEAYGVLALDALSPLQRAGHSGKGGNREGGSRSGGEASRKGDSLWIPGEDESNTEGVRGSGTREERTSSRDGGKSGEGGEGSEDPYLLLMVPARSIQWGWGALGEGEAGSMEGEETWVEIGCRVEHARRVDNVQLSF